MLVEEERVRVRTDLPLEEIELKDVERSGKWDDSYSRLCDELATYKKGGCIPTQRVERISQKELNKYLSSHSEMFNDNAQTITKKDVVNFIII
jgi:hypothetical protein